MSTQTLITTMESVLAHTYALYTKTQNYHWNVQGPNFKALHDLFEEEYTELALSIDALAEHIRALGSKVPGRLFIDHSVQIAPANEHADAATMVDELAHDHALMAAIIQPAYDAAEKANNQVVVDALTQRLAAHNQAAWMLRSSH